MLETRLGRERRRLLGTPEHTDHPAHLGERLASRSLDDEQGFALSLLIGPEQASHPRSLDGHDAYAVTDDVVELARDPGALFGNCRPCALLPLALSACSPLPRLVGLLELATEREADDPHDTEEEIRKEEVTDPAVRIRASHDGLGAEDDGKPGDRLPPVREQGHEKHRGTPGQEDHEVVRRELVVEKSRDGDYDRNGNGRAERKPPAGEQGSDDRDDEDDVEPQGPRGPVGLVDLPDRFRDADPEPDKDRDVEPVAQGEPPERLHGLKVLSPRPHRVVREDELASSVRTM